MVRACAAPASAGGVALRIAHGGFSQRDVGSLDVALALACILAVAAKARRRHKRAQQGELPQSFSALSSMPALALTGALTAYEGGVHGPLAALPVLAVAVCVAMGEPRRAWVPVLYGVALEGALHLAAEGHADALSLGLRVALVVAAGLLHHGLTRAEVARVRDHAKQMIADERKRQKEAAQSFRLQSPSAQPPQRNEKVDEARVRSSLEEIHASIVGLLSLAQRTMKLRTCALYWADAKGKSLRLVEAATPDDADLNEGPLPITSGAMGAAIAMSKPVLLSNLRADHPGLTYYRGAHDVRCFAGVPVLDQGTVRGVMVADRVDDLPFSADDQATLEAVALQARRLIDNERVFARLERAKDDMSRLFEASRALGEALTEDQVLQAVATSAKAIVEHDLLVVTSYDAKSGEQRVRHVSGEVPRVVEGLSFGENSGIACAAVKARHALPYRGHFDPKTQYVFTREAALSEANSVSVFPLVVRDAVLGTLTLAANRRAAFTEGTRQLLGVLAAHASVALSNAAAVRRLEELATTDPMTGHLNKRALESEFDKRLKAASRFGHTLSVIVLDIDKFKNVNDTYGHAVGDTVIKGLGAVLGRCRRETDAVGRFGGEEFVIVCEETDTEGAFLLAERIREELKRQVFQSEIGPLSVTCSLGIAEFPRDAEAREALFTRADEALYEAKHNGRNQTRTAGSRSPSSAAKRDGSARKAPVSRRESSVKAPQIRPGVATSSVS
ncbi:MAG: sensor domain-containing diguanylate cyclase [Polyangiales bacterium]